MGREKKDQRPVVYRYEGMFYLCKPKPRGKYLTVQQYTTNFKARSNDVKQKVQFVGNNAKSMHVSVEASLKKLRTSYIDLLYLHWWDWDTSVEEIMRSLHLLVQQGKVIYLVRRLP